MQLEYDCLEIKHLCETELGDFPISRHQNPFRIVTFHYLVLCIYLKNIPDNLEPESVQLELATTIYT